MPAGSLFLASVLDIGLMKLLAITHRALVRDYLDLAAIIRDHVPLSTLLKWSKKKYGKAFNPLLPVKALVAFDDIEMEMPVLLDKRLGKEWRTILSQAVQKLAA